MRMPMTMSLNISTCKDLQRKCRFLMYDTEFSQDERAYCPADKDMLLWYMQNDVWYFRILNSLLKYSPKFRGTFAQYYYSLCNENFNSERMINRLEELRPVYEAPLAETYDRFAEFRTAANALDIIDEEFKTVRDFWEKRADCAKSHLVSYLTLQIEIRPGDVNGDAAVTAEDAVLLQNWLQGKPESVLSECVAGDLNADGRIDAADLSLLKQYLTKSNLQPHQTGPSE